MILGKTKILDIDGPYEDALGVSHYAEVHFESREDAEKWIKRETRRVFPRRRFFEWLLDKISGE